MDKDYVFFWKKGREVTKISRSQNINLKNHFVCDLEKNNLDNDLIADNETIFHLAGYAHDLSNTKNIKEKYTKLNVDATRELALQASELGVKKFIFVSSVKASLFCSDLSYEDIARNVYAATKRQAELNLIEISKKTNMKICIIRPSLVYGPNLKGNLLQMKTSIQKGWFPPLPQIDNRRSMIHVDDLARAMLMVEARGVNGEIYNVTDGKDYSTTEIFDIFYEMLKKKPPKLRVPLPLLRFLQRFPEGSNSR